jgi:hypothetical protein
LVATKVSRQASGTSAEEFSSSSKFPVWAKAGKVASDRQTIAAVLKMVTLAILFAEQAGADYSA